VAHRTDRRQLALRARVGAQVDRVLHRLFCGDRAAPVRYRSEPADG
jgi:hypothetical protein